MYFSDGNIYFGDWLNDQTDGKGVLILMKAKELYQGEIKKNLKEGKGDYLYHNGNRYSGEW